MPPVAWVVLVALQAPLGTPGAPQASPGNPVAPTYRVPPPELREPISYESVRGLTIFRAKIAGQDAWVLADNGAQRSIVDLGFAARAKLVIDSDIAGTLNAGAGLALRRVRNVSISVHKQFETTLPVMVGSDLSKVSQMLGREIAMVMGADFYRNFAVITLPAQKKLQIVKSGQTSVPMRPIMLVNAIPQIIVDVEGQPLTLSVDTGASVTMRISTQAWSRLGKNVSGCSDYRGTVADGSRVNEKRCLVLAAKVGPMTFKDLPVIVGNLEAKDGDGFVGMEVLNQAGGAILDIKERKMWLLPRGADFVKKAPLVPLAN